MTREPFIAHSELTNEIYIVAGDKKYCVTEQAIKAVKAIKALEQEPTTKNNLGVDCISRADAERILTDLYHSDICDYCLLDILEDIKALPPVTPIRPKGHWIEYSWNDNGFGRWGLKCDKCLKKYKYGGEMWGHPCFCPNCGADMREVEE